MGQQVKKRNKPRRKIKLGTKSSPFLLPEEAALYLRLELKTLANFRSCRSGPKFRRHGGVICYHENDLDHWSDIQTEDL